MKKKRMGSEGPWKSDLSLLDLQVPQWAGTLYYSWDIPGVFSLEERQDRLQVHARVVVRFHNQLGVGTVPF